MIRESGEEPGFADQRSSTGSTKRKNGRRAWRGSRARLQINTQRAPGYKYAERTRGSDCINCRRKEEQNRGAARPAQSEFKAALGVRQKNVRATPLGLLARETQPRREDSFAVSFFAFPSPELRFLPDRRLIRPRTIGRDFSRFNVAFQILSIWGFSTLFCFVRAVDERVDRFIPAICFVRSFVRYLYVT